MTTRYLPFLFQEKQPFERIEVSRDDALKIFAENKFKVIKAAQSHSIQCHSIYIYIFLSWHNNPHVDVFLFYLSD